MCYMCYMLCVICVICYVLYVLCVICVSISVSKFSIHFITFIYEKHLEQHKTAICIFMILYEICY